MRLWNLTHLNRAKTSGFALAVALLVGTGTPYAEGGPIDAFGLPHVPLGQAQLELTPGGLLIANIGSSGQDGVLIDFGLGPHVSLFVRFGAQPGVGSMIALSRGPIGGDPEAVRTATTLLFTPDGIRGAVDFGPIGATSEIVQVYQTGGSIFELADPNPSVTVGVQPGCGFHVEPGTEDCPVITSPPSVRTEVRILTSGGKEITVPGFAVRFIPVGAILPPGPTSAYELRLTATPPMLVDLEKLEFLGNLHIAIGEALLEVEGPLLRVTGIGASGEDGVGWLVAGEGSEETGEVMTRAILTFGLLPVLPAGPMSAIKVRALGTLDGVPETLVGGGGIRRTGPTSLQGFVEFEPLGATLARVEVLDAGRPVGSAVVPIGPAGAVASIDALAGKSLARLTGCGKLINAGTGGGDDTTCVQLLFEDDVQVSPGAQPGVFIGDEVRLLAENPVGSLEGISKLKVLARNIPGFTVVSEHVIRICPADITGDGTVGFKDLIEVLVNWGCVDPPGPCPGDVNGDGTTGFADLLELLGDWGPCP